MDATQEVARHALKIMMETISERCWCAGWMDGLEYAVWRAVEEDGMGYGQDAVYEQDARTLRWLAEQAGGWWAFPPAATEEVFVPLDEWLVMYLARTGEATPVLSGQRGAP